MSSPGVDFCQVQGSLTAMLAANKPNTIIPKIIEKMIQINKNCECFKYYNNSNDLSASCGFLKSFSAGKLHFLPYLYAALEVLGIKPKEPNWNYRNIKEWDGKIDLTKFFEQRIVANNTSENSNNNIHQFVAAPINSPETTAAKAKILEDIQNTLDTIKAEFDCPITCEKIKNPAVTSAGNLYEREAIEEHLTTRRERNLPVKDPISNVVIEDKTYPLMLPRKIFPLIDELEKQVALLARMQSAPAPAPLPKIENTNAGLIEENARLRALVKSLQEAQPMPNANNDEKNANNCDWKVEIFRAHLLKFPDQILDTLLGYLKVPLSTYPIKERSKKVNVTISHLIEKKITRQTIVDACAKSRLQWMTEEI